MNSSSNPALSSDNTSCGDMFKVDQMDEFEEVVCEEIVESCLEQIRKYSARYSELDVITERSGESSSRII